MEDILQQIIKDATGTKFNHLRNGAQNALDKLHRQHGMHRDRDPSYELRSVSLFAMQLALETRRPKFVTMALNGMHRIIKDERFYIGLEPEDDSVWLPAQLLRATSSVSSQNGSSFNEETLVNVLRLFLAMACTPTCTLNGRLLIEILSRCGECWENGARAIKAASLAAASQCLRTFCSFLQDEADEILKSTTPGLMNAAQATAVYNEVIPVMQWLCSRLIEPRISSPKKNDTGGSLFLTECILSLASTLPRNVQTNPHFTAFLWQKFCPTLAAALGSPNRVTLDKKFTYMDALHIIENETRGFFTGPGLDAPQARCVYLTAIELVRIAGAQASLRPMLEALFHRMILLPSPQNRTEPLRCVKEIFKSPARLVDLTVILFVDKNQGQSCSDDMALFRLIIDAMEECALSGQTCESALHTSVECIVALLASLQTLCTGDLDNNIISENTVKILNGRYSKLREVDYTGPLTYQSMARLPAAYRDAVAELRQHGFETSSGSESDLEQIDPEIVSNGSGDTEGPEDELPSSDDVSAKNESNWPYSYLEAPAPVRTDGDFDRHHAREFSKSLAKDLVPKLLRLKSSVEVDEALQEFASSVCQENSLSYSDFEYNLTAMNADGIYLATCSALLLSIQLMKSGHYDQEMEPVFIPLSEQQFVTSVQNTGVLVYLSTFWLCELYQCILASNPLASLQREDVKDTHCALIDLLQDAGGFGATQMLSDWQHLQSITALQPEINERKEAARKLSRRLLTCCWDSMVAVLSAGLGQEAQSTKNRLVALSQKTLKIKRRYHHGGEALFALSLDGLHAAATLSNSLSLQHLAGKILNLLAGNVCQTVGPRITASQALSMDVVLSGGLELGSYSSECWLPVFTVCRHVTQLEHELFSLQNTIGTSSNGSRDYETGEKTAVVAAGTGSDKLNLTSCPIDDDETCVDVYSFLQAPHQNPTTNVASILKHYTVSNETSSLLSQSDSAKILSSLSHQADNLFSDSADRLSLPPLCQFIKSLCRASREQLYRSSSLKRGSKVWWPTRSRKQKNDSLPLSLLLHRVGDVTLRVFRSSRPLLHIFKMWAIAGPHLMDAACHRDRTISKRAIEYIQDIITALLVEQSELPHFHFNEALLKPFENLLSMETCDIDVQDQIVACLYEIVEAHRTEIRSGWRPLFGTLRNARNRPLNIANITDIFRVFLDSDNTLVFANAGLDCILCLLSYLEISGGNGNAGHSGNADDDNSFRPAEFLHDTLKFLERCASILAFMYNMPKCPNFHSAYKIKGISYTHVIDANIPNSMENFTYFGNDYLQNKNEQHMISYRSLHIDKESITKIDDLDKTSGVLKVWFLLLDGLTNSLIVCPSLHQAPILQTILKLFKNLSNSPGIDFGFYCINHLLIPMIQDWLRYVNKTHNNWHPIEKNFKHCCGMTTDLVVEFIEKSRKKFSKTNGNNVKAKVTSVQRPVDNLKFAQIRIQKVDTSSSDDSNIVETPTKIPAAATLALKQLLLVLIECSAQTQETIARVGVSCLKHVILSTGRLFNENQWMIACSAIHRASTVTIAPLRQLSFAFHEKSNSFYGDCANVKVAARKDCTIDELNRINGLAQQVFLMDGQRDQRDVKSNGQSDTKVIADDRSYSFLLYPLTSSFGQNLDNFVIRIPYRSVVVGLLANQMLLQVVAKLLLGNLKCVPREVHSCISDNYSSENTEQIELGFRSKEILLRCAKQYLTSSIEFDSRPGLKFLMQKVANIDFAANLYKQMTSSWMIYYVAMVDSYLNDIDNYNLTTDDLTYILESCSRLNTSTVKKKENFVRYLFSLQDAWNLVCEVFLNYSNGHNTENGPWNGTDEILDNRNVENENNEQQSSDESHPNQEENISMSTLVYCNQRTNPFDSLRLNKTDSMLESKTISPEIEQQRATSIYKDLNYKRSALAQLVVASIELLRSLPESQADNLRLLMTPTIREAFRLVQCNETNVNKL